MNPLGGEFRVDLQWGKKDLLLAELFQPLDYGGRFVVLPRIQTSRELFGVYSNRTKSAEYDLIENVGLLAAVYQFKHYGYAWAGYQGGWGKASTDPGGAELPTFDGGIGEIRGGLELDQLDDPVFARSGFRLSLEGTMARDALGDETDYDRVDFEGETFASAGDHTLRLALRAASALGSELPAYRGVFVGGVASFPGLAPNELVGQHGGVATVGYRYRMAKLPPSLGKGVYLVVEENAGNVWQQAEDISPSDLIFGTAVALGADTVLGPIYVGGGFAEGGRHQFFFSLGSRF